MSHSLTLRIAVCDDEPAQITAVCDLLTQYSFQHDVEFHLTTYGTVDALLQSAEPHDLLFLDIMLGTHNGIDVAKQLRQQHPQLTIVFLTSSVEFAIDGYSAGAFRYLLKPLTAEVLHTLLQEYCQSQQDQHKSLLILTDGEKRLVKISEILYIMSSLRQLQVTTIHDTFYTRDTLQNVFTALNSPAFAYCNKGCIVHLAQVLSIKKEEVLLRGEIALPISRRYKQPFVDQLTQYINQFA